MYPGHTIPGGKPDIAQNPFSATDNPSMFALARPLRHWRDRSFLHNCRKDTVFRDRAFGEVAPNAFAAWREPGLGVSWTGRVSMRGLYLIVPSYPWDGVVLWFRRFSRRASS
jgi:hypothetical protein